MLDLRFRTDEGLVALRLCDKLTLYLLFLSSSTYSTSVPLTSASSGFGLVHRSHSRRNHERSISHALARQKYWQIRTNFTAPLLYNHILKLYPNDYRWNEQDFLTCLAFS